MKCRLSTNSVRSLLQDDEGFVWLGTDAGLLRLQVGDHYSC
ncbi:two-component regulator propeller domain-containing protein [Odoribacter splanchnicus]